MRAFTCFAMATVAFATIEYYPFTPHVHVEPIVNCTTDADCGNGWCRKNICACDWHWATYESDKPCEYRRYSKATAMLMQIFLGAFAVGISVLHWVGAVIMYWGSLILCVLFLILFARCSTDDDRISEGICAAFFALLAFAAAIGVYLAGIVLISGDACMDAKGVSCF